MPPKKQVVELPVIEVVQEKPKKARKVKSPVPEELELNRNYETDPEFHKNMEQDFDKLFSLDFGPVKKSKPKVGKVKSPVPEELELNRNYEAPVKESKPMTKKNPWIEHIKAFALQNGITYNKAMLDPRLKETYIKSTKGKVTLG
jgi:hypothetical protein